MNARNNRSRTAVIVVMLNEEGLEGGRRVREELENNVNL
jgi:hypothetical protein